jgi:hypothetical protein
MSTLSVRVSEDPARPLGHAIVTLGGLPRGLETFEFALSRHGFPANHLGPDGWQGAECWLQPEEVWYSGDALKFVLHPDLAFQLENMPYRLAVRGQGLAGAAEATFVWPLELALEEGGASGERRVVGGARVESGPKPRPAPAGDRPAVEPPPLPEVGGLAVDIPDVPIPEIGAGSEPMDDHLPTRVLPPRPAVAEPADADRKPRPVAGSAVKAAAASVAVSPGSEPTRKVSGRLVPPVLDEGRKAAGDARAAPEASPPALGPVREPPTRVLPPRSESVPESRSVDTAGGAAEERRGMSGPRVGLLGLLVLAALAALAAVGWWWFGRPASDKAPPVTTAPPVTPGRAYRAPEPKPAPEPRPAPEPVPAPEPKPAPEPVPAPEPRPAPVSAPAPPAQPTARPAPSPIPVERDRPASRSPVEPTRPASDRSLEDELKSQFDPTVQELEKQLRPRKTP